MIAGTPPLKVLLDEGVPVSVGATCNARGYGVLYHADVLLGGEKDEVVCETALRNDAVLIAIDGDMKGLAHKYGVTPKSERFKRLNLIRLCCNEVLASKRIEQAFTLIEVEWAYARALAARRMWIDILKDQIRSHR